MRECESWMEVRYSRESWRESIGQRKKNEKFERWGGEWRRNGAWKEDKKDWRRVRRDEREQKEEESYRRWTSTNKQ